ncbi:MAG: protein-disulfide reductase DsbD domain-containing protein, partial [Gammaproteobacteria bacterium]
MSNNMNVPGRSLATTVAVLASLLPAVPVAAKQEILRPEQAFRYVVDASEDEVVVNWMIEPGHYLYRERMHYSSRSAGVALDDARMPAGK